MGTAWVAGDGSARLASGALYRGHRVDSGGSADLHYFRRLPWSQGLTDIGKRVVDDHADRLGRIRVTDRTLEGFENAIEESLGRRTPGPG